MYGLRYLLRGYTSSSSSGFHFTLLRLFCDMLSAIPTTWWSFLRFLSLYVMLLIVSCY